MICSGRAFFSTTSDRPPVPISKTKLEKTEWSTFYSSFNFLFPSFFTHSADSSKTTMRWYCRCPPLTNEILMMAAAAAPAIPYNILGIVKGCLCINCKNTKWERRIVGTDNEDQKMKKGWRWYILTRSPASNPVKHPPINAVRCKNTDGRRLRKVPITEKAMADKTTAQVSIISLERVKDN